MQAFVAQFSRTPLPRPLAPTRTCLRRPRSPPSRSPFHIRAMSSTEPSDVSPAEAQQRLQDSAATRYLDVRTPAEFADGHPPGALNVPVTLDLTNLLPTFADDVRALVSADTELLVGCKSGSRSKKAIAILQTAGFENITNVDGGFRAWAEVGLPVEK